MARNRRKIDRCGQFAADVPSAALAPGSQPIFGARIAQFKVAQPHIEHSTARNDGQCVQAREFNSVKEGQAPTLVMMHAFPDNQHLYALLITELSQNHQSGEL